MLVVGAKGHAKEVLSVLQEPDLKNLVFFDDVSEDIGLKLFDKFPIIRSFEEACSFLELDGRKFILGIGRPKIRKLMFNKFSDSGFEATSAISDKSWIGSYDIRLGVGLNIMHQVFISNSVFIGDGTLINSRASVHHDCKIGDYVEIGPNATLLGNVEVGNLSFIGASATVLANVKIGENAVIGAGSVVTKDVSSNTTVIGVPAKAQ